MKISQMAGCVEPSLTRKLFNMAGQYEDVIDLTLGDPDLQPNPAIKAAACEAINRGNTRYSANAGLPALRGAIGKCVEKEYGIAVDCDSQIAVTVGGMEALYLTFAALIDAGDEVIIFAPYYVNYIQMIRMCGGKPVILYTDEEQGFVPAISEVRAAVTDRTVAIVINSPSNPGGVVFKKEFLDELAALSLEYDLTVISDEVYKTLLYDGRQHESIYTREGMQERTVLIDSISKRFAMTGYRLGYLVAPKEMAMAIIRMQENVCACAPLPSQYAAIEALGNHLEDTNLCHIFEKRRDVLYEEITSIEGLHCLKPEGTFYAFVNISGSGLNCMDFAIRLLESQHVAVVPAISYGEKYTDHIRIAFTKDEEVLREACRRIRAFMLNGAI